MKAILWVRTFICEDCGQVMYPEGGVGATKTVLKCVNRQCINYGKKFKAPTVELEKVEEGKKNDCV